MNPLNANECARIGRLYAGVWCKNGKYKSRRQLKEKCLEKNVKLCDHKSGCNDFLKEEIRVPAQNAVVLPNLKLTCGRV